MVENVGRKVVLILALLAASALLLLVPDRPMPLGLDISGGTRLVYRLDLEEGRDTGAIGATESDEQVMSEQIDIIRKRVDPDGTREAVVRKIGVDQVEIAVPDTAETGTASVRRPLAEPVGITAQSIRLAGTPSEVAAFPSGGGVVSIGAEYIRYTERNGAELRNLTHGEERTAPAEHAAGEIVTLISDDAIKNAIENLGDLRFYAVAQPAVFSTLGTDEASERAKLTSWLAKPENAEAAIKGYNELEPAQGGPPKGLLWFPHRQSEVEEERLPLAQRSFLPLLAPPPEETFTGADLARVGKGQDQIGYPSVTFQMRGERANAFGAFTEKYEGERMAIVLNDEIVTAPTIEEPLYGSSQITGKFQEREVDEMVTVLRSGSLKIKPKLANAEKVGASLGDDHVRRNVWAGLVALAFTFTFMASYYRRLGWIANAALLANLLLLLGVMVLLQATLTLPGMAGIVLTIGMAVDANILIFDRIREESEKGQKPIQAAKEGFRNALSAIVDGNLTTLIAALILYNVGTGPIRGFAVTLSVGIATSLFAALVITRVMIHFLLQRGVQRFSMARWLADANLRFLDKGKYAFAASGLFIAAGLTLFILEDDKKKLGIDFLGGASIKVRTESPLTPGELRARVAKLPGDLAQADVVSLPSSEVSDGRYTEFRVTAKGASAEQEDAGQGSLAGVVRAELADVLQKGPIEIGDVRDGMAVLGLYFESAHEASEVQETLVGAGFAGAGASAREGQRGVFTASVPHDLSTASADDLRARVQAAFADRTDAAGRPWRFSNPIPETSVIGSQVVGELRDSAIKALILSMILTVIYIRVRFAEYSYGIAAVVAVAHDVLTTLTAVAILIQFPVIRMEMNLTLIAAFLTILGYSLNDTIIIFDRVRENLPKYKKPLAEIVDISISQTLSRTICTTGSTITSAFILLLFNFGTGNAVESFAFALFFGVVTGTYSTIYIACPLYVWLEERSKRRATADAVPVHAKPA